MHDLLLLLFLIRGNYDVDVNDFKKEVETTRQTERVEYRFTKARNNKPNNNFIEEQNCFSNTFL